MALISLDTLKAGLEKCSVPLKELKRNLQRDETRFCEEPLVEREK